MSDDDEKHLLSDWDLIDPRHETEEAVASPLLQTRARADDDGLSSIFKILSGVELDQSTTTEFGQGESSSRGEKRKYHELDSQQTPRQSEGTDIVDEESKETQEGGKLPRRPRSAEIHNDQERRRRERIRGKIKVLQDLVPNCSETNPASILDDAIAHIKSLKSQLEVMTMGQDVHFQSQNPFTILQQTQSQQMRVPEFYPAMWPRMPFNMGMNSLVSPSNYPLFRDNSQSSAFHPMFGGPAVPIWHPHFQQMPMIPYQTQGPVRSTLTTIVEPSQIVRPSTSRRKTTRQVDKESKYPSSSQA